MTNKCLISIYNLVFRHLLVLLLTAAVIAPATSAQIKKTQPSIEKPDAKQVSEADSHLKKLPPTIPVTPGIENLPSQFVNGAREFRLTASVFQHQLSTFPKQFAEVWGYNKSIPGPTAIAYEGEKVRFVITNLLPEPTTIHFHGTHAPNDNDGVAGVSQLNPVNPGETFTYEFMPQHTGTFAYHSHFNSAKQELKGLDGMFIILPRRESKEDHVDRDFVFTLQSWLFLEEGGPVIVFPGSVNKEFNIHTMNGQTRDAAEEIPLKVGEKVRLRVYNVGNLFHAMHEHGFDLTVESQNGHKKSAPYEVTTFDIGPGNFFEVTFTPDKPGKWLFHCHVPHHTTNETMSGPGGSPAGMSRVFNITQ